MAAAVLEQSMNFINNFKWEPGVTPLSDPVVVVSIAASYPFIALFLGWLLPRIKLAPIPLGHIPTLHNIILCLGSLAMFLGALHAIFLDTFSLYKGSFTWVMCFPPGTTSTGPVFFWSYIYYLSKFYELLDTVILVLRKKELSFLHLYHHSMVMMMCYFCMQHQQSIQTIGLMTNTGVHVVMYFYFFLNSIGIRPKWKRLVTNIQISQFCFGFTCLITTVVMHCTSKTGGCAGMDALAFTGLFNASLLALFTDFHRRTYAQKGKKAVKEE